MEWVRNAPPRVACWGVANLDLFIKQQRAEFAERQLAENEEKTAKLVEAVKVQKATWQEVRFALCYVAAVF
jgi:hypothetical protein